MDLSRIVVLVDWQPFFFLGLFTCLSFWWHSDIAPCTCAVKQDCHYTDPENLQRLAFSTSVNSAWEPASLIQIIILWPLICPGVWGLILLLVFLWDASFEMKHHLKLWDKADWVLLGKTCLSCTVARSCHSSFCPSLVTRKATPF